MFYDRATFSLKLDNIFFAVTFVHLILFGKSFPILNFHVLHLFRIFMQFKSIFSRNYGDLVFFALSQRTSINTGTYVLLEREEREEKRQTNIYFLF